MILPMNFQFSQSNLQDFVDCRRRFQLKHLLHLAWPAVEAEPVLENERLIELGSRFHHLLHQFTLGIPVSELKFSQQDRELALWWENFQTAIEENGSIHNAWLPTTIRYPEITLSGRLGDVRIVAKIDLLAVHSDGSIQIFDWKTAQQTPRVLGFQSVCKPKFIPIYYFRLALFSTTGIQSRPTR
jgi:hypothetical protein